MSVFNNSGHGASETMVLQWSQLSQAFKKRPRDANKGDFGHVLVIGGDYGFGGAVHMAAEAALRVGAGLVSVATHAEHVLSINETRPEIMCHAVEEPIALESLLKKATVIVVGPGLQQNNWSKDLFKTALKTIKPTVVDADALNLLSKNPQKENHWILTPHVGEAARLLSCDSHGIQKDRVHAIKTLVKKYDGVVVLKGAGTLIADKKEGPFICNAGNPGMASGGMGDVLSGVIGGLLAQHFSLLSAAKTGVMLHALAGDLAAKEKGERGLLASDLMPYLQRLVNPEHEA
ncbi:MAG TPA: NAD(P)H-hydrate dehydratase [Coxiellaceae bacterium]|nr:NAD(P)H-hydrate dehydratase [Coxiellaceae bacterium]